DRTIKTFYVMEQMVTNSLFNEFARSEIGFEIENRKSIERHWQQEQIANSPVTDVYAFEAQAFAWWLAGRQTGSLPSATEWEVAAGYWDFVQLIEARYGDVHNLKAGTLQNLRPIQTKLPNLGADVWIGPAPVLSQFQNPHGELLRERSAYACDFNRLE